MIHGFTPPAAGLSPEEYAKYIWDLPLGFFDATTETIIGYSGATKEAIKELNVRGLDKKPYANEFWSEQLAKHLPASRILDTPGGQVLAAQNLRKYFTPHFAGLSGEKLDVARDKAYRLVWGVASEAFIQSDFKHAVTAV